MDSLVDFSPRIDKCKIVSVNEMFENEVEKTEGGDERTGDGEHDDHGKDEHHPGVLLPKPEFIPEVENWGKCSFIFCHLMAFLMLGVSALLREIQIWIRYQKSSGNLF